jgi:hypothetical protein
VLEKYISVGNISNEYGGLYLKSEGNVYYWGISDYSEDVEIWEIIPKSLYDELIKFNKQEDEKNIVKGHVLRIGGTDYPISSEEFNKIKGNQ